MNSFVDSSISRIVMRLVENIDMKDVCWHVGVLGAPEDVKNDFARLGVRVADFSGSSSTQSIRDYIQANQIDIVHTHTPRTIFAANLALRGNSGVKHLATKHLLTKADDRKWGILFFLMDRLSLYFPDKLIPVSQTMRGQILSQPGIKADRVAMVRNAIPCEQFYAPQERESCREEFGIPLNAIALGYTGRIQKVKRVDILLDAFAQVAGLYPDLRLVLAGDGEDKPQLEAYAQSLGIPNKVIWTGFRRDVPRILAAIDIYVQTSSNEGLSLSILEAMAAGKPVIATDAGGNSEVIRDEISGLLMQTTSVTEVVRTVSKLLDYPDLRNRLATTGLNLVQNEFSLSSMVKGYQALYEEVLSGKSL